LLFSRFIYFVALTVFVSISHAYPYRLAEQKNINFDRIGGGEGLSQGVTTRVEQDPEGFIWIGTQEGLNRYDGYRFKNYYHIDGESSSLPHNYIRHILFTVSGQMYVSTDGGLALYRPEIDAFESIDLGLSGDQRNIYYTLEDQERRLWIATREGVCVLLPDGQKIWLRHSDDTAGSIGGGAVRTLMEDDAGKIWIGMEESGVFTGDIERGFVSVDLGMTELDVRDFLEDSSGKTWVATFNNGVFVLDASDGLIARYRSDDAPFSLGSDRVRTVLEDSYKQIWLGTDMGLHLLIDDDRFLRYQQDLSNPKSISDNTVLDLVQDSGGVIWAATYNGVSKWNALVDSFPYFRRPVMGVGDSQSNIVTSFIDEPNGDVWVGTLAGLIHWDAEAGTLTAPDPKEMGLNDSRVMSLGYSNGLVLAGTINGGINVISDGLVQAVYEHEADNPNSVSSNAITRIYTDRQERLWVATYGGGVNLHLGNGRFKRFPELDMAESFSDLRCLDIYQASDGRYWITTQGGGVLILDSETGEVENLRHDPEDPTSLPSNEVISLLGEESGIWVGSINKGLAYYDFETSKFTRYNKTHGLASDSVFGILSDEEGRVWVSGGRGLSVLDVTSKSVRNFDQSHGLQGSDFNSGAYAKLGDGSFAFGGTNGFNVFYAVRSRNNSFVPPVQITDFKKFNKSFGFDEPLGKVARIDLQHDETVIGFEFAALDYTAPEKNQYRYMLEGFDKNWVNYSGKREATYTNLDAGTYTFKVRGSNNDGVWNEEGASINLVVHPAPWLTWWAYSIYLALFALALYMLLQYNSARQQRRAEKQYSERLQLYIESIEEASDCILIADADGTLMFANKTMAEELNRSQEDLQGQPIWSVLFEDGADIDEAKSSLKDEGRYHGEVVLEGSKGEAATHEVTIASVSQSSTSDLAYVGISRDVTERKKTEAQLENYRKNLERLVAERTQALQKEIAENKAIQVDLADSLQEKELLLKEVHHRVKNNMQVISSLLSIQAESVEDDLYVTLLNESQQRIKSMALIHETLYQSKDLLKIDFHEYISTLTTSLSRSYSVPGVPVHVAVNVEDVALDLETAVPCGLIINELVSNSLKHAFHDHDEIGVINIDFDANSCLYELKIADNGCGLPDGFDISKNVSMGLEIVSILTSQLEGRLEFANENGAMFQLSFPRSASV